MAKITSNIGQKYNNQLKYVQVVQCVRNVFGNNKMTVEIVLNMDHMEDSKQDLKERQTGIM